MDHESHTIYLYVQYDAFLILKNYPTIKYIYTHPYRRAAPGGVQGPDAD